jgi:hypothetical protein
VLAALLIFPVLSCIGERRRLVPPSTNTPRSCPLVDADGDAAVLNENEPFAIAP